MYVYAKHKWDARKDEQGCERCGLRRRPVPPGSYGFEYHINGAWTFVPPRQKLPRCTRSNVEAEFDDHLEEWDHDDSEMSEEALAEIGRLLESPRALSEGHKRTIRCCRMLWDEIRRHRPSLPET